MPRLGTKDGINGSFEGIFRIAAKFTPAGTSLESHSITLYSKHNPELLHFDDQTMPQKPFSAAAETILLLGNTILAHVYIIRKYMLSNICHDFKFTKIQLKISLSYLKYLADVNIIRKYMFPNICHDFKFTKIQLKISLSYLKYLADVR